MLNDIPSTDCQSVQSHEGVGETAEYAMTKAIDQAPGAPYIKGHAHHHPLRTGMAACLLAITLAGCSSGGGGDGGRDDGGDVIGGGGGGGPSAEAGLQFSYPPRDQRDVFTQTQIVLRFADDSSGRIDGLTLAADGEAVPTDVIQDEDQPNIVRLQVAQPDDSDDLGRPALQPATDYSILSDGDTLLSFTTEGVSGAAAADGFEIVERPLCHEPIPSPPLAPRSRTRYVALSVCRYRSGLRWVDLAGHGTCDDARPASGMRGCAHATRLASTAVACRRRIRRRGRIVAARASALATSGGHVNTA